MLNCIYDQQNLQWNEDFNLINWILTSGNTKILTKREFFKVKNLVYKFTSIVIDNNDKSKIVTEDGKSNNLIYMLLDTNQIPKLQNVVILLDTSGSTDSRTDPSKISLNINQVLIQEVPYDG